MRLRALGRFAPGFREAACPSDLGFLVMSNLRLTRELPIGIVSYQVVTSQYLTPGQDATQAVDAEFPVEALKAKKLKEIRLELSYVPTPFKEEKLNFTVSIGGQ